MTTRLSWLALLMIAVVTSLAIAMAVPPDSIAVTLDPGTVPPHPEGRHALEAVGSRLIRIGFVVLSALTLLYVVTDVARRTR